jgi:hypothetical protein
MGGGEHGVAGHGDVALIFVDFQDAGARWSKAVDLVLVSVWQLSSHEQPEAGPGRRGLGVGLEGVNDVLRPGVNRAGLRIVAVVQVHGDDAKLSRQTEIHTKVLLFSDVLEGLTILSLCAIYLVALGVNGWLVPALFAFAPYGPPVDPLRDSLQFLGGEDGCTFCEIGRGLLDGIFLDLMVLEKYVRH